MTANLSFAKTLLTNPLVKETFSGKLALSKRLFSVVLIGFVALLYASPNSSSFDDPFS
jgi:hypothetical protein